MNFYLQLKYSGTRLRQTVKGHKKVVVLSIGVSEFRPLIELSNLTVMDKWSIYIKTQKHSI